MKAVILAGGYGTRLSEETHIRPKPMAEIGGRPILWHIMKIYASQGITDFVILCGYRSHVIKEYFANYALHHADVTFDLAKRSMVVHKSAAEPWKVTLVETGEHAMTGGRLIRAKSYIGNSTFFLTYGDGVSTIDFKKLLLFHKKSKALATLTAVQPPGRYGAFTLRDNQTHVENFREKPHGDGAWVNGGFFVLEPDALSYITGESTVWEQEPLKNLAKDGKLAAYKHTGFWHSMDTLRDKTVLEDLWKADKAPWKIWK